MTISKFLDPKNDVAFRKVFGDEKNKDILIHFINDILELKEEYRIKDLTFLPTVQVPEIAAKKQSIIDVLCVSEKGTKIIVEMQVSPQEDFEKRAQYYAAKAYSRQLNKGEEEGGRYKDLKEVIFIAICDRIIFKNKLGYKSDHIILDKKTHEHNLKDFSFTFIELPKFKINKIEDLSTIVEKWCYFFKYAETTHEQDIDKIISSDKVIEKAYHELNRFYWTEAELNSYDSEIKRIMDNLAAEDYLRNVSRKEGREEGREEGEKIGEERGKIEGLREGEKAKAFEIAKNLLSMNLDIDVIVKATGLTKAEIESLKSQKNNP